MYKRTLLKDLLCNLVLVQLVDFFDTLNSPSSDRQAAMRCTVWWVLIAKLQWWIMSDGLICIQETAWMRLQVEERNFIGSWTWCHTSLSCTCVGNSEHLWSVRRLLDVRDKLSTIGLHISNHSWAEAKLLDSCACTESTGYRRGLPVSAHLLVHYMNERLRGTRNGAWILRKQRTSNSRFNEYSLKAQLGPLEGNKTCLSVLINSSIVSIIFFM